MKRIHLNIYSVILFLGLFFSISSLKAQTATGETDEFGISKFYLGGNLGASFGTITNIYVSPELSYRIKPKIFVGLGFGYQYYKNRNFIPPMTINTYSGRIFGQYYFYNDFFAHVEYERLHHEYKNIGYSSTVNARVDGIYGGVGYRSWMGPNSFWTFSLLFDLQDNNIQFGINPFIRIGMAIGL